MYQATSLHPSGGHPHLRDLQGTAHSSAPALTLSSSKDSAGPQSMNAPPSTIPSNKLPQAPSTVRNQEPGQSWGHPGAQGPRKHTVRVFTVCFNPCPNPASYLASPYCTEQETEAPEGQGGRLKPHGW